MSSASISPFAAYPYLWFSLAMVLLMWLITATWPRHSNPAGRLAIWCAALLGAPFGLLSFEFIPKYWNPNLRFWFGFASLEDLLFSGAAAGISWALAAWPFRDRLRHGMLEGDLGGGKRLQQIARRFLVGATPGVAIAYAIKFSLPDPPVILGTMWGIAIGGLLLLRLKPGLWPLSAVGGVIFSVGYALLLKTSFAIYPELTEPWHAATQPHSWVGGVPLNELLWAFGFGAVWPLFVGYCLDTRWISRTGPR